MKMDSIMPNNKILFAALFLGLIGAWPPALGQSLHRDQVAEVDVLETFILFHPFREATRWDLSVSGPEGFYRSTEFFGESPFFLLEDEEGVNLPDGRYTFELRAWSPTEPFDPRRDTQSGSFSVVDGQAEFLGAKRKDIGDLFPAATNLSGNHFVGPLTTDSDFCAGCADGDLADVGSSAGRARLKGFSDYLIFDEDSPDALWRIGSANEVFFFDDLTYGTLDVVAFDPGAPTNSLRISSVGSVGLGTATPAAALHVRRSDGAARALVEETGFAANRIMMELRNRGSSFFKFTNTFNGQQWTLNPLGNSFTFDNLNFPGQEFRLYNSGRLVITPSSLGSPSFDLGTNGNLFIAGDLTANGFFYPSDRNQKRNIRVVNAEDVLGRLMSMQISRWNYEKGDPSEHMGPMAQDFHAAFGLGPDDRHLSPTDTAGVALAAIQGLYKSLQERDAEIERLKVRLAEMEALRAELAEIRSMLGDR